MDIRESSARLSRVTLSSMTGTSTVVDHLISAPSSGKSGEQEANKKINAIVDDLSVPALEKARELAEKIAKKGKKQTSAVELIRQLREEH